MPVYGKESFESLIHLVQETQKENWDTRATDLSLASIPYEGASSPLTCFNNQWVFLKGDQFYKSENLFHWETEKLPFVKRFKDETRMVLAGGVLFVFFQNRQEVAYSSDGIKWHPLDFLSTQIKEQFVFYENVIHANGYYHILGVFEQKSLPTSRPRFWNPAIASLLSINREHDDFTDPSAYALVIYSTQDFKSFTFHDCSKGFNATSLNLKGVNNETRMV